MAARIPIPPYPRWTGMTATLGPPRAHGAGYLAAVLTVPPLTRRARLWLAWQIIAGGDHDAPANQ